MLALVSTFSVLRALPPGLWKFPAGTGKLPADFRSDKPDGAAGCKPPTKKHICPSFNILDVEGSAARIAEFPALTVELRADPRSRPVSRLGED